MHLIFAFEVIEEVKTNFVIFKQPRNRNFTIWSSWQEYFI